MIVYVVLEREALARPAMSAGDVFPTRDEADRWRQSPLSDFSNRGRTKAERRVFEVFPLDLSTPLPINEVGRR